MNKSYEANRELWRQLKRVQQPDWDKDANLKIIEDKLAKLPPLVFAGEVMSLRKELSEVEKGNAFIIQGGDCAETFEQCQASVIRENLKVLLQMSVILTFSASKHVVKLGRIAGQYAKPRSSEYEEVDGKRLKVYRGDMVNSEEASETAREAKPSRMLDAYFHAAATLNLVRGYTKGGFASLENVHFWNKEFVKNTPQGKKYEELSLKIDQNLAFIRAVGLKDNDLSQLREVNFYTSHEALILEYESALTRTDSLGGKLYGCSAHLLWIGERTRQKDGAHVEFCKNISNPIGIKIGAEYDLDDILAVIDKINPQNETGKVVIIPRLGKNKAEKVLTKLVRAVKENGLNLSFCSDPMHGNTFKAGKYKTRNFDDILQEIIEVDQVLKMNNSHLGGIHIETTGLPVTECLGGMHNIDSKALEINYSTSCDPRLNVTQSVELAFLLAERL